MPQSQGHLAAVVDECVHGFPDGQDGGFTALHLGLKVVLKVRAHHEVVVPPFVHSDLGLGLDHCVDPSHYKHTQDTLTLSKVHHQSQQQQQKDR